jgi:hypothetical protein
MGRSRRNCDRKSHVPETKSAFLGGTESCACLTKPFLEPWFVEIDWRSFSEKQPFGDVRLIASNRGLLLCGRERLYRIGEDFDNGLQSDNLLPHFQALLLVSQVRDAAAGSIDLSALRATVSFFHSPAVLQEHRRSITVAKR